MAKLVADHSFCPTIDPIYRLVVSMDNRGYPALARPVGTEGQSEFYATVSATILLHTIRERIELMGRGGSAPTGRIWNEFLTAEDQQALAGVPERPKEMWGFGERPALLLIDLYRAVFGERPEPLLTATKRWPQSCGLAAWDGVPAIQSVIDAARNSSVPVVHVTGLSDSGITPWSGRSISQKVTPDGFDPYEIMPEFAPLPGEAVIRKLAPSAFFGTLLMAHLTSLRIDTLIVCGESTSGCVRATVVDGRSYRFNVIVVEEGVFDRHQATHALNLFDMHQKYADVLRLSEVLGALKSTNHGLGESF